MARSALSNGSNYAHKFLNTFTTVYEHTKISKLLFRARTENVPKSLRKKGPNALAPRVTYRQGAVLDRNDT